MLGGTEDNGASIINVIFLPCRQMNDFLQRLNSDKKFSGLTCRNPVQGRLRLGSSGDKSRPRRSIEAGPGFCGHNKCLLTNTFF